MVEDAVLSKFFSEYILNSYLNDLIRTICSIVDKNFGNASNHNRKSIEFVSRWLLLVDDDDQTVSAECSNQNLWRLAHVHTSLEYEQNDLLSVYSACRIVELFDSAESSSNQDLKEDQLSHFIELMIKSELNRSEALKKLFKSMFKHLWTYICKVCLKNDNTQQWIRIYHFISTYYPSNKMLDVIQLGKNSTARMEFMRLAYLIFLNEKTPDASKLISNLFSETKLDDESNRERLDWHEILPNVINSIQKYFENKNADVSTLIIDISQWIMSILRMSIEVPEKIGFLLKYLNQPMCPLSLSMKQFLFDELMQLSIDLKQNNNEQGRKQFDCIDRINFLLPIVFECCSSEDIQPIYRLPYHPSVISSADQQTRPQLLLDLLFFHLKSHSTSQTITCAFVNKALLQSDPLRIKNINLQTSAEKYLKQLKDYFSIEWTAQLVCEIIPNESNIESYQLIMETMIDRYLAFDIESVQFSSNLLLFLSTIILKSSWNYLLKLLRSDHIQNCKSDWANALYDRLDGDRMLRHTKYLSEYHQIQFTVSTEGSLSCFPKLHRPYDEMSKIIDGCVNEKDQNEKWKALTDWIQSTQNADPCNPTLKEIKVMLLLKTYYNYYCANQLSLLNTLLELIENLLEPSAEELLVFRALLQPEKYMIGYTDAEVEDDQNFLNKLFKPSCDAEDELAIRHSLVNLMTMILMGGEQNFLWTFAFKPITLENTYGK